MSTTVAQKLRIREGSTLRTLHAPANFEEQLQPLPANIIINTNAKTFQQLHWFVKNRKQVEEEMHKVLPLVKEGMICWTYYPKGTSGIQTDLTRDKGWEALLANGDLQWLTLVSFDDTWSTFGFRLKTDADKKKEKKPNLREIFDYINPVTKEIRLPEDLSAALHAHPVEGAFFEKLSFSNKKEYVEWVITAKREATRAQRITGAIDRLAKGWKNPGRQAVGSSA